MKQPAFLPGLFSTTVVLMLLSGCTQTTPASGSGARLRSLDLSLFTQIPTMRAIDAGAVSLDLHPSAEYDYWELRGVDNGALSVLAQGGNRKLEELSPDLRATIEKSKTGHGEGGFGRGCLPAWCFKYVLTFLERGNCGIP